MEIPFVGGAYTGRSKNLNAQVCQNYYPILDKQGGEKVIALMGTPGLLEVYDSSLTYRVRGVFADDKNGTIYAVFGDKIRRFNSAYSATNMTGDDLGTTTGKVWIESNGIEIMITDGAKGYIVTIASGVSAEIIDGDFPVPSSLTFQDGYFIVTEKDTDNIFISALYDGTSWGALDYAAAEGSPDTARCVYSNRRNLWIPGTKTTEVFYNSGDVDFPFERVAGAVLNVGIRSVAAITSIGDTVYWLDSNGQARRSIGYESQVISTSQIDFKIASMSDISDCECYGVVLEGEESVIFQFPTADETLVYSPTSGFWHTRATGIGDTRHPIGSNALFGDDRVVGHISDGKLYKYDLGTFMDCGDTFNAIRAAQAVHAKRRRIFHDELEIEMELAGTGGVTTATFKTGVQTDDYDWDSDGNFSNLVSDRPVGDVGGVSEHSGFKIKNVAIAKDSKIIAAYGTVAHGGSNPDTQDCKFNCYFEDVDEGAVPADAAAADVMTLTDPIPWAPVPIFTGGAEYNTPSLVNILQRIINRQGFVSGNDINFVLKNNGSDTGVYRVLLGEGSYATGLTVTWISAAIGNEEIILQYSDDHGNNWSLEKSRNLGAQGEFKKRIYWQKLGSSRDRIYRIKIADAVKRVILGAQLKASIGRY
ncbi:MAG: hypothetical protein E3J94_07090 [Desulfobacteraceae bacterium]|nr:MAG: hypothetical protein E3J94_07090 [Desulfobacteraceae bacterium]